MSETMRQTVEIIFNISYLLVVWSLVFLMAARQSRVDNGQRPLANRLLWAFALLALGDSGHVGFRVIAYARGGLEANPTLVGIGALSTAITVTFFYMILVDVWRMRFQRPLGWPGWLLLGAGVVRLAIMAFPQNQWEQTVAPYGWSLLRNAFLVIQGVGVMVLILRDAGRTHDRTFTWIGIMIACSYLFYAPVILFATTLPILGMLMIPKTCAYVAVAVIAFRAFYLHGESLNAEPAPAD